MSILDEIQYSCDTIKMAIDTKGFDLIKALKDFTPYNEIEKTHLENSLHFLNTQESCFSRANSHGHITGSAFLLNKDFSKILLTHHAKLNRWLQFGGHSDNDKNTLRVAVKEVIEESGISDFILATNGIFDVDVHRIPYNQKKNECEHYHYDIRFLFQTSYMDFQITDESNDIKWFTFDEFMELEPNDEFVRFAEKWKALLKKSRCN